jgi:hypothetical protein
MFVLSCKRKVLVIVAVEVEMIDPQEMVMAMSDDNNKLLGGEGEGGVCENLG